MAHPGLALGGFYRVPQPNDIALEGECHHLRATPSLERVSQESLSLGTRRARSPPYSSAIDCTVTRWSTADWRILCP